ncbi:MAG TPA: hypothetical protein VNO14_10415 [Blastocatellia bacterium]|nr:hypothetical protein [Blastocatellia bacterium]
MVRDGEGEIYGGQVCGSSYRRVGAARGERDRRVASGQARALDLPDEARARFLRENARRVFKLD